MPTPRDPDRDRFTGEHEPVTGIDRTPPEFDPRGYLKVPGESAKVARAIRQCPSIFELGTRIKTITTKTKGKK